MNNYVVGSGVISLLVVDTLHVVIVYGICLCVCTLGELTKHWIIVLGSVSDTLDDRGMANA